jgi:hypothetical protein
VLAYECLREVELGLHDREPILLEQERGGLSITEVLSLSHERRELSLEDRARLCRRLPQLHMPQCGRGLGRSKPPDGWTRETSATVLADCPGGTAARLKATLGR